MTKRVETEIAAAFFTADYDEPPGFVRLDTEHPDYVGLPEMLGGEKPNRPDVLALIERAPVLDPEDHLSPKMIAWHKERADAARSQPLRVYRVRVVAELEELPQDEAERWVAEALARDVARSTKDGE